MLNQRLNLNFGDNCGERVDKRWLSCIKCNLQKHKECNKMRMFRKDLQNECKTFILNRDVLMLLESLPFHQVINIYIYIYIRGIGNYLWNGTSILI